LLEEEDKKKIEEKAGNEFENLEKPIKKIVEFVEKIPDKYQTKAFEILFQHILSGEKLEINKGTNPNIEKSIDEQLFQMPIEVRAFLRQFSIPEDKINDLFIITGPNEIAPTYNLKTTKAAVAQIQLAVLTALENSLKGKGKFEFDIEDVRKRCNEHKCYDAKNFTHIFTRKKILFKDLDDHEHIFLSPHGKEHLAEVMNEL